MAQQKTTGEAADMRVAITDLNAAKKSLAIEVPAAQVGDEYERACRKYSSRLKIPGFRQGKVPPHIIKQRFGKEIEQETIEQVIKDSLDRAVSEASLKPLRAPVLKEYRYVKGEPLSFTAELEVLPRVSVKGLGDVRVKVAEPAVTDRMMSEAMDTLRERAARFDPVEGRGLRPGDHALVDISGRFAPGEGEDFSHANALIEIGSGGAHPELTDALRDMEPGTRREFTIAYPTAHPSAAFAGRRLSYDVTLREIKTKVLPDLDDEFARDLGKFENLQDLKAKVTADLLARERRRAREEARGAVVEGLLTSNPDVAVPEVLVDQEVDRRMDDLVRGMVLQGMDPRRHAVDWDGIREKQREPASRAVRAMILLDAIAEEKKISLESRELDAAVQEEAALRKASPDAIRAKLAKDGRLERLSEQLLREKVLDFLLAVANT